MKQYWWKILGAALVMYALVAGLWIPLKPGVEYVKPDNARMGESVTLSVRGYNAHYAEAEGLQAWLMLDSSHYLAAKALRPKGRNSLELEFQLPGSLPDGSSQADLTLVLDNEVDGYSLLPDALLVRSPKTEGAAEGGGEWLPHLPKITTVGGITFPYRNILYETIRNLFYHVPLWFAMMILFFASAICSLYYLRTQRPRYDHWTLALNQVGILYGLLGLLTGAIWANWTWGAPWSGDVKQNMSAIAMLVYLAYLVLRSAFEDYEQQARVSAAYNIFAFIALIPLLFVIPRLYDSLHPGNGGNPGFGSDDLDNTMRLVFYPAIIGFTLLGLWMADIARRLLRLHWNWMDEEW